jgi:hypothetical protein
MALPFCPGIAAEARQTAKIVRMGSLAGNVIDQDTDPGNRPVEVLP